MSDLVASVNGIFEKIAEVIDLSFFPPGAACLAAALYWNEHNAFFTTADGHGLGGLPGWFQAGGALLASYVLGLLCFTAGRVLRGRVFHRRRYDPDLATALRDALTAHGAAAPAFTADYLQRNAARPLHARMWTEIREDSSLRESYRLLQHYWVMTATYDGMAAAFVVWAVVILDHGLRGATQASTSSVVATVVTAMFFLLMMAASVREAKRVQAAQIEELAATLTYRDARRPAETGSAGH